MVYFLHWVKFHLTFRYLTSFSSQTIPVMMTILIARHAMFSDEPLIKARMSSSNFLFVNPFDTDVMLSGDSPHFEGHVSPFHDNTFVMLLKLIHGSVIDSGIPDNNFDNDNISANSDSSLFPTMSGVAEKAAKEGGNRLDQKQMIVYETNCSTFLLGLVNEGNDLSSQGQITHRTP